MIYTALNNCRSGKFDISSAAKFLNVPGKFMLLMAVHDYKHKFILSKLSADTSLYINRTTSVFTL